ncbi:hypothetical protein ACIHFD_53925 [Nonomuraea sp. NPDC051941]|uniref:nSTAND1 domain-containing NTPase n=1 Tax=Nonomuraea sp. NPDC051941 TaxID=3364373 RepID=UPI0037C54B12
MSAVGGAQGPEAARAGWPAIQGELRTPSQAWPKAPSRWASMVCADFYGSRADFPHLREALAKRQVIVSAMTDDEVRQAVTLPTEESGLSLATGLVGIILRDLCGATGQGKGAYRAELLSRLARTLRVMWLNREGDTSTVAGYHASRGIDDAIASTTRTSSRACGRSSRGRGAAAVPRPRQDRRQHRGQAPPRRRTSAQGRRLECRPLPGR